MACRRGLQTTAWPSLLPNSGPRSPIGTDPTLSDIKERRSSDGSIINGTSVAYLLLSGTCLFKDMPSGSKCACAHHWWGWSVISGGGVKMHACLLVPPPEENSATHTRGTLPPPLNLPPPPEVPLLLTIL